MRCRKKFLLGLTTLALFLFVLNAQAPIVTNPTFFPSLNGSYITFDSDLLPLYFVHPLYRDSFGRWFFNNTWISTTANMEITSFNLTGQLNYTVSGGGVQQVYVNFPETVFIDGVNKSEGDGWSYAEGVLTITDCTVDGAVYFFEGGEEPEAPDIAWGDGLYHLYFQIGEQLRVSGRENIDFAVSSGLWNGSGEEFIVYWEEGHIVFYANNDATLNIYAENTQVKASGASSFGETSKFHWSLSFVHGETVTISWKNLVVPWLPLMFILGMVGILCVLGGAVYGVSLIRDGKYEKGLVSSIIFIGVGASFVLAWLWA